MCSEDCPRALAGQPGSSVDDLPIPVYPVQEGILPSFFFSMQIRALFFASYRELLDTRELDLSVPAGTSVAGLVEQLRGMGGAFSSLPPALAVAVNQMYVPEDTLLSDGDVVAFIPPVAGG
ncbi:molybdopterin converting factor subunit 1 [Gemmatimonadota bacterium]